MKPTTDAEPINITPMTPEEARECDAEIHRHLDAADKHLDSAGALLLDMKRREGWKALDFGTWTEYLESRAVGGKSRRRALELLQAEEVSENLAMCGIPHTDIPTVTSQLTMLAQLPPEQQAEGLHKADERALAEGKKRTADHVAKAVKEIKSVKQETQAKGKALGLPTRSDSTLPESDRIDNLTHTSPADVDDRPGAAPPPSPWALMAEFPITVGDGSIVQVKFSPEGLIHRFDFRGAVSETGYYCEFIPAQIAQRYRSPKECATALADDLHAQWMKAKPKPYKHGIAAGDTVRILLGRGKHSDKITTATSVTAKEILTPLGTFKPTGVVKYIDRTAEMKALGIVPEADVQVEHLKAKVTCTFADGRVLVLGRYYHYSEVTVLEKAAAQPTEKPESTEAEDSGAIARSVESMLPIILASESEPNYEKQVPADLTEVSSTADMDALIDFQGTTVVARMYVQALPELQAKIKDFYPGIGAIVTSELGGSEFNKIADRAGFLPNHEPDAVRVEMLLQENARLDQALRLCEEHVERLEQENRKLHRKLESQQTELDRINKENTDLQERIRNSEGTAELQRAKIT